MGSIITKEKTFFEHYTVYFIVAILLIVFGSYSASSADTIKRKWRNDDAKLDSAHKHLNTGAWIGLGTGIGLLVILILGIVGLFFELEEIIIPIGSNDIIFAILIVGVVALAFGAGVEEAIGVQDIKKSDTYKNSTDQNQLDALNDAIHDGIIAASMYLATSGLVIIVFFSMLAYDLHKSHKKHKREKELKEKKQEKSEERKKDKEQTDAEKRESAKKLKEHQRQLEEEQFKTKLAEQKAKQQLLEAKAKQATTSDTNK